MATRLVIVESPTKAHKIGDYLGKGYTVMASVGDSTITSLVAIPTPYVLRETHDVSGVIILMNHVQLPNSAVVPGKFGRSHPMFYRLGGAGGAPIRPSRLKGAAVI